MISRYFQSRVAPLGARLISIAQSIPDQGGNSNGYIPMAVLGVSGRGMSVQTRPMANTISSGLGQAGRVHGVSTAGVTINLRYA